MFWTRKKKKKYARDRDVTCVTLPSCGQFQGDPNWAFICSYKKTKQKKTFALEEVLKTTISTQRVVVLIVVLIVAQCYIYLPVK